jgi:hypothetical protein
VDAKAAETGPSADAPVEARAPGGEGGVDATSDVAYATLPDGTDDTASGSTDAAADSTADAAEAGQPISCAETNGCVASDAGPGAVFGGYIQTCNLPPLNDVIGTSSEWVTYQLPFLGGGCPFLFIYLYSSPGAVFDMDVYQGDPGDPPTCPAILGSFPAVVLDAAGAAIQASTVLSTAGTLFVHVVARDANSCNTGLPWILALAEE